MKRKKNVKYAKEGMTAVAMVFALALCTGNYPVQAEDLLIVQEDGTDSEQADTDSAVSGDDTVTGNAVSDAEVASGSSVIGYDAFDAIIQKYISGFEAGWESSDFDENGLCYLAAYLSGADEMGYYLTDIDGDGSEELLIGEKGNQYEEDAYTGMFYEMYTLNPDTGEAIRVAVSGERSRYYLCTDGTIGYEGSGGYNYSGTGHYQFDGTALEVLSFVLYDGDYDSENPYFYSTADTWDDYSTPISEAEAAAIRAAYEYMDIPYLAFTEAAAGTGKSIFEAAGTDTDNRSSGADASGSASALKTQASEEVAEALEQADEIVDMLDNEPLSQSELNQYSYEMYQIWDNMLNTLWGYLKEALSEEEMAALTEDELVWITEKDDQVAAAGAEFEGGTMQPYLENTTAAAMTKERVYVLLDLLP